MPNSFTRLVSLAPSRALVMNCGATHVAAGEFKLDRHNRLCLDRFAYWLLDPTALARKPWAQVVGDVLAAKAKRENWSGGCTLALSGQHTLTKFVRVSVAEKKDRESLLTAEVQKAIPCPLSDVVWDHTAVEEHAAEIDVMVAATKREVAEALHDAVQDAGLVPERILPGSTALLSAFRFVYPHLTERTLLFSLGARSTHLIFLDRGRFFSRTFMFGGHSLSQAVADEMGITFADGERLKREVLNERAPSMDGSVLANVQQAFARFRQRLIFEVTRTTALYRERYRTEAPQVIFLTGGASLMAPLAEDLKTEFSCQVERFDLSGKVELWGQAAQAGATTASLPLELIGLAAAALLTEVRSPNLVPPDQKERLRVRRRNARLITSALFLVGSFFPPLGYWELRARRTVENRTRVEARVAPLRERAARNTRNLAAIEQGRVQIESLHRAVDKKTSWIRFLTDLQDRLGQVQDVWLERLQLSPASADQKATTPRDLTLGGRLLDVQNPISKVSSDSYQRVRVLMRLLSESPFVTSVRDERFDNTQPGILRFSCTLVMNAARPL